MTQFIEIAEMIGVVTSAIFGIGIIQLVRSMLGGYIDWGLPSMRTSETDERARTEEMSDEEVPDISKEDDRTEE